MINITIDIENEWFVEWHKHLEKQGHHAKSNIEGDINKFMTSFGIPCHYYDKLYQLAKDYFNGDSLNNGWAGFVLRFEQWSEICEGCRDRCTTYSGIGVHLPICLTHILIQNNPDGFNIGQKVKVMYDPSFYPLDIPGLEYVVVNIKHWHGSKLPEYAQYQLEEIGTGILSEYIHGYQLERIVYTEEKISEIKCELEKAKLYMHNWEEQHLREGQNVAEWKAHLVDSSDCHSTREMLHPTISLCWNSTSYMPPWWYELVKNIETSKHDDKCFGIDCGECEHIKNNKCFRSEKHHAWKDLKRFEIMGVFVPEPPTEDEEKIMYEKLKNKR